MEEARREASAALDDPSLRPLLASFVDQSWAARFGLVGVG